MMWEDSMAVYAATSQGKPNNDLNVNPESRKVCNNIRKKGARFDTSRYEDWKIAKSSYKDSNF